MKKIKVEFSLVWGTNGHIEWPIFRVSPNPPFPHRSDATYEFNELMKDAYSSIVAHKYSPREIEKDFSGTYVFGGEEVLVEFIYNPEVNYTNN